MFYKEQTVDYLVELTPAITRLGVENDRRDFRLTSRGHRGDRVQLTGTNFGERRNQGQVILAINGQNHPMPVQSWADDRIVVGVHNITPLGSGNIHVSKGPGRRISNPFTVTERIAPAPASLLTFATPVIIKPRTGQTRHNPQGGRDLSDHYALAVEVTYSPAAVGGRGQPVKFTLFTYNIAQVPTRYAGYRTKQQNIDDIAAHLNNARYGIVCLQEAFDDDTRDRLKRAVNDNYPYQRQGHDGDGPFENDSGLLILSHFPILETHRLKYSEGSGLLSGNFDFYAAKGVLHTRIQVGSSQERAIDLFTTHTDSGSSAVRSDQFGEAIQFIRKYHRNGWWILAGDLNVNGNRQRPDYETARELNSIDPYSSMMMTLDKPRDLWTEFYSLVNAHGYTVRDGNDFEGRPKEGGSRVD